MLAGRLLAILAVLVAGAVMASGAWFIAPWLAQEARSARQGDTNEPVRVPPDPAAKQEKANDTDDLGFDVVRIGPKEPSVFAGRAPPDSVVSITANGKSITTAKANDDGEWVALPEAEFSPGEYDITLEASVARPGRGTETTSRSYKVVVPPAAEAAPVSKVASNAEQRSSVDDQSRPRPVTFVYDEAIFTSEGEAAAAALTTYVRANGFAFIELSGHADERGSREHNEALSRRRAEAVARYLRQNGYGGQFTLMAVGAAQPYAGVDRMALPQERVFQYDRRVELRLAR